MAETQNANLPGLAEEVLAILRCIDCENKLAPTADGLRCVHCSREYPMANGVLRFVDAQAYAGSFGFQWTLYSRTQLDNQTSRVENLRGIEQPISVQGTKPLQWGRGNAERAPCAE